MHRLKILTIVCLLLIVVACDDDESKVEVPRAAPGTIVMKLNGAELPPSATLMPSVTLTASTGDITILGAFKEAGAIEIATLLIYLHDADKTGQFQIKGNLDSNSLTGEHVSSYSAGAASGIYYSWKGDGAVVGKVNIVKFDLTNKLISGTFEVKLYNDASALVDITDGAFTDMPITIMN